MTFKVQLSDGKFLEIGVREEIEEEPDAVAVPIEEIEAEQEEEEEEEMASARRGRRLARFLALGGLVGASVLLARSLRRRTRRESMRVEVQDEEELAA